MCAALGNGWQAYDDAVKRMKQQAEEERLAKQKALALCELCGVQGEDMRTVGSPLSYIACSDVPACEKRRKDAMLTDVNNFAAEEGWPT